MFYKVYSYDLLDEIQQNEKNNENINNIYENDNECTICLEKYIGENNNKTYDIDHLIKNNYNKIIKKCECNYNVHYDCLNEWFTRNTKCIICRKRMSVVIVINDNEPPNVSRYFIVRVTVKLINGILIANYTIYIIKTVYRTLATLLIYSVFLFYLVNIIKKQYERITSDNIDLEYETLE
jgi:hypothetical protein